MARSDSILKIYGTLAGLTFVKSSVYGDHIRARRGTYKKAKVNAAFKKESKTLLKANVLAKIIKEAIAPYLGPFTGGMLWQRLVSLFVRLFHDHGAFDFSKIGKFEFYADHPFDRLLPVDSMIKMDKKKSTLQVDLHYDRHPDLTGFNEMDGYQLTVICIFPDLKKKTAKTVAVPSGIIRLTEPIVPLRMHLDIPAKANNFMLCLKIEGCIRDALIQARATNRLCTIASGNI